MALIVFWGKWNLPRVSNHKLIKFVTNLNPDGCLVRLLELQTNKRKRQVRVNKHFEQKKYVKKRCFYFGIKARNKSKKIYSCY